MRINKNTGETKIPIRELDEGSAFIGEDGDYYIKTDESAPGGSQICVDIKSGIIMRLSQSDMVEELPDAVFFSHGIIR